MKNTKKKKKSEGERTEYKEREHEKEREGERERGRTGMAERFQLSAESPPVVKQRVKAGNRGDEERKNERKRE